MQKGDIYQVKKQEDIDKYELTFPYVVIRGCGKFFVSFSACLPNQPDAAQGIIYFERHVYKTKPDVFEANFMPVSEKITAG